MNLTNEINRRISILFAMGVPFMTSRDLEPRGLNCLVTGQKSFFATEALTFADVSFSFVSHFVLLSACFVTLWMELLASACSHHYNHNCGVFRVLHVVHGRPPIT